MKCPLCLSQSIFQSLFSHTNTFVSCGRLDSMPNLEKSDNYAYGDANINLAQCVKCGFIHNTSFDREAIWAEYSSEGYLSRKIVSNAMNITLQTIKNAILHHYVAMGGGGVFLR